MPTKLIELKPIKETPSDWDELELIIQDLFKQEIYYPLLKEINIGSRKTLIENAKIDLLSAIRTGKISFYRGHFKGSFNATLSKELRALGAKWDRTQGSWRVPRSSLSDEIKHAISASENNIDRTLSRIDTKLAQILPEEIADKLKIEHIFERNLWKTNKDFKQTIKDISIAPTFTEDQNKRIAKEYTKNLQLYIQDFTKKEIVSLREDIQKSAMSGNRYESMIKTLEKSYGVSHRKAKFLARQETSLLMTKFKQTRYEDAGVNQYRWGCVVGSGLHPVRPMHKALEGKVFSWNNPPITDENGNRNNPGQDYNCRCFARPIVRF